MSEMVQFAAKAMRMAEIWQGGCGAVEELAGAIRKVSGFGGKGFRMKARPYLNNMACVCMAQRAVRNYVVRVRVSSAGPAEEVLLDLAEATKTQYPSIQNQLVDFGVVGPGPRRALNFVNNRCPP